MDTLIEEQYFQYQHNTCQMFASIHTSFHIHTNHIFRTCSSIWFFSNLFNEKMNCMAHSFLVSHFVKRNGEKKKKSMQNSAVNLTTFHFIFNPTFFALSALRWVPLSRHQWYYHYWWTAQYKMKGGGTQKEIITRDEARAISLNSSVIIFHPVNKKAWIL